MLTPVLGDVSCFPQRATVHGNSPTSPTVIVRNSADLRRKCVVIEKFSVVVIEKFSVVAICPPYPANLGTLTGGQLVGLRESRGVRGAPLEIKESA